ncbi:MAG TPA: glycosyltransferase [Pyrinomonadaceae bacterium]|jgi:glycosyltransferase involved in cell wall biosynthesis
MIYNIKESLINIYVAIVLPYLNEQESLASTCRSLGFGTGVDSTPRGVTLFLIDNGSTDDSAGIAEGVKNASLERSVIIGHESERGYVPPRHCGNMMAQALARSMSLKNQDVLILQADADTYYNEGYAIAMRSASQASGPNVLIEACVSYPPDFETTYPKYIELCNEVDQAVEGLFANIDSDVIVDDKVSGYRLSDYFGWGGHQREYTASGDEIHSETARLYMKAKAKGAERFRVDSAPAYPSLRKVIQEPALHFASAGFPREVSWNERWRRDYSGPTTIDDFCSNTSHPDVQRAIQVREQHLIAIFGLLPLHVDYTLKQYISPEGAELATTILPLLPKRSIDDLQQRPGTLISDVFELIDSCGTEILSECLKIVSSDRRS